MPGEPGLFTVGSLDAADHVQHRLVKAVGERFPGKGAEGQTIGLAGVEVYSATSPS